MKRVLPSLLAAGLVVLFAAEIARAANPVFPQGDQRRSMGNLLPGTVQPVPSPSASGSGGVLSHQRYSYGNPPYYQRPPVTPYYVVPQYVNPYYASPYYASPYYGYSPYGGYYVQPYPVMPQPYYVAPRAHRYVPRVRF
ncbi:MAG TPA: hypothetical protein VMY42_11830 [Thermoguttaceae bacterium]|nr:hypothetical protein [Thermoguttaceae bacterium]